MGIKVYRYPICYVYLTIRFFLPIFQEYNRHSELLKPETNAIDHGPSNYHKSGKNPNTFIFSLHSEQPHKVGYAVRHQFALTAPI